MCGIIGAALRRGNAAKEVYEGLKRLEYRGYDSAGLSVSSGGKITTVKRGGRVEGLEQAANALNGNIAVGHTRWATHGRANDINAHPHNSGAFSLVHNGIIENWQQLRQELIDSGASFNSQTDSEVIVKLIDSLYKGDFLKAVADAVKKLKGSFALAVLREGEEGFVAVKYKSPAVIGFAGGGVYLCSDVPALDEGVTSICIPEDGDIVYITADGASFYNFNLTPVTRVRRPIKIKRGEAGKGDYPYYMLKEICEEGRTVKDTAESFTRSVDIKRLASALKRADKVIITGCGTAYNAGLASKRLFEESGLFTQVEIASELRYFMPKVTPSTLVLAITQSGETADTIEAAQALKEAGATVVAVTNCGFSAITRVADITVPVCAGAELCVAATKSYTGQLAALYLIARLNVNVFKSQSGLISVCPAIEETLTYDLEGLAKECAKSSAVFFLGRGVDYAVAVEAALKLKEISYIFSDGYPAGELKHGTLALVDGGTLSVFIITEQKLAKKCENAVEQVISRGGRAAVITTLKDVYESLKTKILAYLLPQCREGLSPFVSSAALQLLAYKTALLLHRDPDKPRNLAKSVTVE